MRNDQKERILLKKKGVFVLKGKLPSLKEAVVIKLCTKQSNHP
jgi:hypothetical protein